MEHIIMHALHKFSPLFSATFSHNLPIQVYMARILSHSNISIWRRRNEASHRNKYVTFLWHIFQCYFKKIHLAFSCVYVKREKLYYHVQGTRGGWNFSFSFPLREHFYDFRKNKSRWNIKAASEMNKICSGGWNEMGQIYYTIIPSWALVDVENRRTSQ